MTVQTGDIAGFNRRRDQHREVSNMFEDGGRSGSQEGLIKLSGS
jgi:hypothetical protein